MDRAGDVVIDRLTLVAVAGFAYVSTTFFHEGVGHGGACLAVGGHPAVWGAYYFDCDTQGLPAWCFRLVAAAGSTVNLILFGLCSTLFAWRLSAPGPKGALTLFLWIMAAINGLTWAGYFMFSGLGAIGDWSTAPGGVLAGLSPGVVIPARIAMVAGGGLAYWLVMRGAARRLARLTGGDRADRARTVALTTYLTGGVTAVLISLANPVGLVITIVSAAASSLGGTSGLLWIVRRLPNSAVAANWSLPRREPWIAVGVVVVAIYAVVWGPSLRFAHGG